MAGGKARLPPRWFIVIFWHLHRRVVQASRGRRGLWPPRPGKWGALRLTTQGRRSGEPRSVIVGYYEDGSNLITMAMNGWGAAEPAWWLNLQAHPEAVVELAGGIQREVLGRAAVGGERERLWQRWSELDRNLDGYAARRPHETAVVVLEPRAVARRSRELPGVACLATGPQPGTTRPVQRSNTGRFAGKIGATGFEPATARPGRQAVGVDASRSAPRVPIAHSRGHSGRIGRSSRY